MSLFSTLRHLMIVQANQWIHILLSQSNIQNKLLFFIADSILQKYGRFYLKQIDKLKVLKKH